MNWEHFQAWLADEQGYRKSTVLATLRDSRQLFAYIREGYDPPKRLRAAAYRLKLYHDAGGFNWPPHAKRVVNALLEAPTTSGRGRGGNKRSQEARSFGDAEWVRLTKAIEKDEDTEARVLQVMAATGLRIGDVLRLTKRRLKNGLSTGRLYIEQKGGADRLVLVEGAPDAWNALADAWNGVGGLTVAELVSPEGNGSALAGDAAYRRVVRKLKDLGKTAGVEGRVNSHRLRRTVGVQALRVTEDVPAVAQLLGHRSTNTTMGYLDEARPERVAELQQQLKERFRE